MTRRIFLTTLAVTVLAVVLFGVPFAIVVNRRIHDDAVIELRRAATWAAVALPPRFDPADPIELPVTETGLRLAVYDSAGRLVSGAGPPAGDVVVAATTDGGVHEGVV